MKKIRTTEIVIETHQVFRIRRPLRIAPIWCADCAMQSEMVAPELAASIVHVNTRAIYRRVEAGQIHYFETPTGNLLVCLNSLAACPDMRRFE